MKTLLIAVTHPGSTILLRGQLSHFREQGYRVVLVCSPGAKAQAIAASEGVLLEEVPMKREISFLGDIASIRAILRIIRLYRPDIVNCGTPKAGLLVGVAAWLLKVPQRYFTLRGLRSDRMQGRARWLVRLAEIVSCRVATQVIAISPSLLRQAWSIGILPKSKGVIIHHGSSNGVDSHRFSPTAARQKHAETFRRKLGISKTAFVIGFVGRIHQDKGVYDLAQAFEILAKQNIDAHLVLVGRVEEQDTNRQEFLHLKNNNRIHVTGRVEKVENVYLAFDCVVLTSYREGFGNVLLEASSMEVPVIASDIPGCRDAVVHGETGFLVPPRDPSALAKALERLAGDTKIRRHLGKAGRLRALAKFQPLSIWRGLQDLYDRDNRTRAKV